MLTIDGKIVSGLGAATKTVALQLPHIQKVFPEISQCHPGTVNVIIDAQFEVVSPDFVTDPIKWHPDPRSLPEMFGFFRIRFEVPAANINQDAWIYIPYGSPHRKNPYHVEVLAAKLTLQGQTDCKIHIRPRTAKVLA
jgi:hypothetical protein